MVGIATDEVYRLVLQELKELHGKADIQGTQRAPRFGLRGTEPLVPSGGHNPRTEREGALRAGRERRTDELVHQGED